MNDELLFERLASHDGPALLDGAFEDRLYSILQLEMRRRRSLRPALLLAATLLLVLTITAAIAVGSHVIEPPWVRPSPMPSQLAPLEWAGPVRPDHGGFVVQPLEFGQGKGEWSWAEARDAASGWADITVVRTRNASRDWNLELAAHPPGLVALAVDDLILAYGVVLETTGDDAPDWVVGIDNEAPEGEYRLWITNLATGEREEQIGGPYGAMPFFDFSHPSEHPLLTTETPLRFMRFFFLGDPGQWGTSIRFYTWASLARGGAVIAWDYAPDAEWLAVPTPEP